MKRGFLFGLGSFLALGVLIGLRDAIKGDCAFTLNGECQRAGSVIINLCWIALCASLSVLAIWKANAAAPNKSKLHAVVGWLIGFCVIPVVWIPVGLALGIITLAMFWH